MEVNIHQKNNVKIAEVQAKDGLISTTEEALQILVDLYYQDCDKIIIYETDITPDFFDLKTGIAGEILQKFSNYRVQLAIIGDFKKYTAKSIKDFIYESNKGRQVNFLTSLDEALEKMCR